MTILWQVASNMIPLRGSIDRLYTASQQRSRKISYPGRLMIKGAEFIIARLPANRWKEGAQVLVSSTSGLRGWSKCNCKEQAVSLSLL